LQREDREKNDGERTQLRRRKERTYESQVNCELFRDEGGGTPPRSIKLKDRGGGNGF